MLARTIYDTSLRPVRSLPLSTQVADSEVVNLFIRLIHKFIYLCSDCSDASVPRIVFGDRQRRPFRIGSCSPPSLIMLLLCVNYCTPYDI